MVATTLTGGGTSQAAAAHRHRDCQPLPPGHARPDHHVTRGVCGGGPAPCIHKDSGEDSAGDFIDMGELLPEFCAPPREDDPQAKSEAKTRRAWSVQDIFMWIQCFGTYLSVLASSIQNVSQN